MAAEILAFLKVGAALAELVARSAAGQDSPGDGIASAWNAVEAVLGLKPAPRGREEKAVAEALAREIGATVRVQRTDANREAIDRVSGAVAARISAAGTDDVALLAAYEGHEQFTAYLMVHGAERELADQDSDWERDLYGQLLSAAATEFARLVRGVPRLLDALNIDTNQRVRDMAPVLDGIAQTLRQGPPDRPVGWALAAVRAAADPVTVSREEWGRPIAEWGPLKLGVHTAITTADTSEDAGPPAYIPRPHDKLLRDALREIAEGASGSRMVVLSGTSCAGKSRSMYEAVAAVLPDWPVVRPMSQAELLAALRAGIPGPAVIWLDELHRTGYLDLDGDQTSDVAAALTELLTTPTVDDNGHNLPVGPYVVLGSLWPMHLEQLRTPPAPLRDNPAGSGRRRAVTTLLSPPLTLLVEVPDSFTGADPADVEAAGRSDKRVRAAREAGGDLSQISQVLES